MPSFLNLSSKDAQEEITLADYLAQSNSITEQLATFARDHDNNPDTAYKYDGVIPEFSDANTPPRKRPGDTRTYIPMPIKAKDISTVQLATKSGQAALAAAQKEAPPSDNPEIDTLNQLIRTKDQIGIDQEALVRERMTGPNERLAEVATELRHWIERDVAMAGQDKEAKRRMDALMHSYNTLNQLNQQEEARLRSSDPDYLAIDDDLSIINNQLALAQEQYKASSALQFAQKKQEQQLQAKSQYALGQYERQLQLAAQSKRELLQFKQNMKDDEKSRDRLQRLEDQAVRDEQLADQYATRLETQSNIRISEEERKYKLHMARLPDRVREETTMLENQIRLKQRLELENAPAKARQELDEKIQEGKLKLTQRLEALGVEGVEQIQKGVLNYLLKAELGEERLGKQAKVESIAALPDTSLQAKLSAEDALLPTAWFDFYTSFNATNSGSFALDKYNGMEDEIAIAMANHFTRRGETGNFMNNIGLPIEWQRRLMQREVNKQDTLTGQQTISQYMDALISLSADPNLNKELRETEAYSVPSAIYNALTNEGKRSEEGLRLAQQLETVRSQFMHTRGQEHAANITGAFLQEQAQRGREDVRAQVLSGFVGDTTAARIVDSLLDVPVQEAAFPILAGRALKAAEESGASPSEARVKAKKVLKSYLERANQQGDSAVTNAGFDLKGQVTFLEHEIDTASTIKELGLDDILKTITSAGQAPMAYSAGRTLAQKFQPEAQSVVAPTPVTPTTPPFLQQPQGQPEQRTIPLAPPRADMGTIQQPPIAPAVQVPGASIPLPEANTPQDILFQSEQLRSKEAELKAELKRLEQQLEVRNRANGRAIDVAALLASLNAGRV